MKRLIGFVVLCMTCLPSALAASSEGRREVRGHTAPREVRLLARVRTGQFDILRPPRLRSYIAESRFDSPSLAPGQPLAKEVDEEGIPIYTGLGEAGYYHYSFLAFRVLWLLDAYELSSDEIERAWYLDYAVRIAAKIAERAVPIDGAYFFFGEFDRVRHGYLHRAPWASGMRQGQLLHVFSALYRVTGEARYRELADKTFRSLFFVEGEADDGLWVSTVDDEGYLWIEEYPKSPPSHTMNGFIFAIFGVYEYYEVTKAPIAKKLLLAGLTTLRDRGASIRNVGDLSSKSIQYRHNKPRKYHRVHIRQFLHLYHMTGDAAFFRIARHLQDDLLAYDSLMGDVHELNYRVESVLELASSLVGLEFDRDRLYPLKKNYEAWFSRETITRGVLERMRKGRKAYYKALRRARMPGDDASPCREGSLLRLVVDRWSETVALEQRLAADVAAMLTGFEEPWSIRVLLSEHLEAQIGDARSFLDLLQERCVAE